MSGFMDSTHLQHRWHVGRHNGHVRVYQATALLRLAVTLLVLMVPSIARAQMDAGSLRALIADQSSGIVPGARGRAPRSEAHVQPAAGHSAWLRRQR